MLLLSQHCRMKHYGIKLGHLRECLGRGGIHVLQLLRHATDVQGGHSPHQGHPAHPPTAGTVNPLTLAREVAVHHTERDLWYADDEVQIPDRLYKKLLKSVHERACDVPRLIRPGRWSTQAPHGQQMPPRSTPRD